MPVISHAEPLNTGSVASQLTNNVSLFATADYNFALDQGRGTSLGAVPVSRSCGSREAA